MLTTDQKGAIAEAAITFAAVRLGIEVFKPVAEGGRFDLLFLLDGRFIRIQCKWASRYEDVVIARCYSARRNRHGLVRRPYTPEEIDAYAAYCAELDRCFYLPLARFGPKTEIRLRLTRARNNQRLGVTWADDFDFAATLGRAPGAIAQLGERVHGMHEVAGSSPAGSTSEAV